MIVSQWKFCHIIQRWLLASLKLFYLQLFIQIIISKNTTCQIKLNEIWFCLRIWLLHALGHWVKKTAINTWKNFKYLYFCLSVVLFDGLLNAYLRRKNILYQFLISHNSLLSSTIICSILLILTGILYSLPQANTLKMLNYRDRNPDLDRRVLQTHRDLERLNDSSHMLACGLTFSYCSLDRIDSVIRNKEQLYSEIVRTLQQLARQKLSVNRQSQTCCNSPNHRNNHCATTSCARIQDCLNNINYEMEVHRIRKNLQKLIILKLMTIRDNPSKLRPAF